MFDHTYSEDLDSIKRQFSTEGSILDNILHHLPKYVDSADKKAELDDTMWGDFDLGFLNRMNIPLNLGGLDIAAKAYSRVLIFEEMGRIGPGICISLPGPGLSMPPVFSLGTLSQQKKFVDDFFTEVEPVWGAFAITEPSCGSDATAIQCRIQKNNDEYVLDGEKCFVTNGSRAKKLVVFASVAPDKGRFGIRAFVVDTTLPGVTIDRVENMMGLRPSQLTNFSFTGVRLRSEDMLGHTGKRGPLIDAFAGAQGAWDYMRPCLAGVINGSSLAAIIKAESFIEGDDHNLTSNKKIVLKNKIAKWKYQLSAARLLTFKAAHKYDRGNSCSLEASMAKAASSTLSMEIAHTLYDYLYCSAIGKDSFWERSYRDAKAFDILEGTGDMQRIMVSQLYQSQVARR
ncbi:MAG: acyl-CoA dehydrogenase family protein [Pseudobacteriovorax sp.]|nr:acyl-CoA dehydrogenase family protein [Pseudobacteriovorax sp.]